jgi:hypothetical protein
MSFFLVFNRVYRLEIQSVMLVVLTQLCELLPSNLLSGSPLRPLPPSKIKSTVMYIQTVCGWEGVGRVLSCVRIMQEFNILFLTSSEPTKLLYQTKQKHRREGGLRHINTCRKVPLQVNNDCFLSV